MPGQPKKRARKDALARGEDPYCGAKTKAGTPCRNAKGRLTTHEGEGRCFLHGGARRGDRRKTAGGIYAIGENTRLKAYYDKHSKAQAEALDLMPELAMARAILEDWVTDYPKLREQLGAWHESYVGVFRVEMNELRGLLGSDKPERVKLSLERLRDIVYMMPPKPPRVPDILDATRVLAEIGKLVDRITQVKERQMVPLGAVMELQQRMSQVMTSFLLRELKDPVVVRRVSEAIAEAWLDVQIEY